MNTVAERAGLEGAESAVVSWMAAVREQAKRLDATQVGQFADTARRLATRWSRELDPLLGDHDLAEIRGIILDGIERRHAEPDLAPIDVMDDLLVRGERIRHILRDALDADPGVDLRDAGAVARALTEWLPRVPQRDLAALAGISLRQFQRWLHQGGDAPRRLRLVARLVVLLRRAWTPEGVVAWFSRPRRDLGGAPLALLDDPVAEDDLLSAARRGRAQHGS